MLFFCENTSVRRSLCRLFRKRLILCTAIAVTTLLTSVSNCKEPIHRLPDFPNWIEVNTPQWNAPIPKGTGAGDMYYLLLDRQHQFEEGTRYYRIAYKLLSESGVQENSQISLKFDPAYEKLNIHVLQIWREGRLINKLSQQEFKFLQRETGHERQLYDGRLSAVALLEDIRVGDVVDYGYSIEGRNPVFERHAYHSFGLRWGVPVHDARLRVLWHNDRPMRFHSSKPEISPGIRQLGELKEASVQESHVPALLVDSERPSDYVAWPWLDFSDYESWAEVARWAAKQHQFEEALPTDLKEQIEAIRKLPDDEKRILAALRWVQDEIRYLGIFDGIHSHKPYPLDTIIRRRFGDCKDKSKTLVALLRELGFEAYPALVNTSDRQLIKDWLPAPQCFNHLVVYLHYKGRDVWLDPTRSFQRGSLSSIYFPDYKYGLIVSSDTEDLIAIQPSGFDEAKIEITETYEANDYSGSMTLSVITHYHGQSADFTRSQFSSDDLENMQKSYLNHYSQEHASIEAVERIRFKDDEQRNVFTVWESYRIDDAWRPFRDGEAESIAIDFYARVIASEFEEPATRIRTMPFGISHPRHVTQRIVFKPPTPFCGKGDRREESNAAFDFLYLEETTPEAITLTYEYISKRDDVSVEDMRDYLIQVESAKDQLAYTAWVPKTYAEMTVEEILAMEKQSRSSEHEKGASFNWLLAIFMAIALFVSLLIAGALYFWNPRPMSQPLKRDPHLEGLGGWLLLVGFGVLWRPFQSVIGILQTLHNWNTNEWALVGDPSSEFYDVLWQSTIAVQSLTFCGSLAFELLLVLLFFTKRTSFPRLMQIYMVGSFFALLLILALFGTLETIGDESLQGQIKDTIRWFFSCAIWIPYFFRSIRVRQTFLRRRGSLTELPPVPNVK